MGRHNIPRSRRVKVTREVISLAILASNRAALCGKDDAGDLPERVFGSRRVTRRMVKALKAQAA